MLRALIVGLPLILYVVAQEPSLRALLAQESEKGKANMLYYLSQTLNGAKLNYLLIEKTCLALIFAVQKL